MMERLLLLYFPSRYIVEYVTRHPIDWADRELAKRGGDGDMAGKPPTPSVQEFLALLYETGELFTQEEYWARCADQWQTWINERIAHHADLAKRDARHRQPRIYDGLRAKAYRNFYPAHD
jgi:hypothetical protein